MGNLLHFGHCKLSTMFGIDVEIAGDDLNEVIGTDGANTIEDSLCDLHRSHPVKVAIPITTETLAAATGDPGDRQKACLGVTCDPKIAWHGVSLAEYDTIAGEKYVKRTLTGKEMLAHDAQLQKKGAEP
jgi:hypothetical protein